MSNAFSPRDGWGPRGQRAALCLTFDNFGEACEIEVGWWGNKPVGQHYTAAFIPELVEALGEFRGTYFIEASNAEIYPDAIRYWQRAGNEVALHAWRHEFWARLDASQRRDNLRRSCAAMEKIGVTLLGIRPPGGDMPADQEAWRELADAGLIYCSDVSENGIRRFGDIISLPFRWPHVDALYFEEVAASLRPKFGLTEATYGPEHWAGVLDEMLAEILAKGTQATLIFHPHQLGAHPAKLAVLSNFLDEVRRQDIWVARACDAARFVSNEMGLSEKVAAAS